jgi:hypothetical protein
LSAKGALWESLGQRPSAVAVNMFEALKARDDPQ